MVPVVLGWTDSEFQRLSIEATMQSVEKIEEMRLVTTSRGRHLRHFKRIY